MRILIFSFLLLISFISCSRTDNDIAKELIREYVQKNANDPSSYKPISFGDLKEDAEYPVYKYRILHKFRLNNAFGGKVVHEEYFYITEDLKFAELVNTLD